MSYAKSQQTKRWIGQYLAEKFRSPVHHLGEVFDGDNKALVRTALITSLVEKSLLIANLKPGLGGNGGPSVQDMLKDEIEVLIKDLGCKNPDEARKGSVELGKELERLCPVFISALSGNVVHDKYISGKIADNIDEAARAADSIKAMDQRRVNPNGAIDCEALAKSLIEGAAKGRNVWPSKEEDLAIKNEFSSQMIIQGKITPRKKFGATTASESGQPESFSAMFDVTTASESGQPESFSAISITGIPQKTKEDEASNSPSA